MFEDGIVKPRQHGFNPETSMYCFGGDGGDNSTSDDAYFNQQTGAGSKLNQAGPNTRIDSRGNRVNFNTSTARVDNTPNYTKVLPNGVQVVDYSRPFGGQVNLSSRGTPEVVDLSTQMSPFSPAPVTDLSPQGLSKETMMINTPAAPGIPRPDLGAVSGPMIDSTPVSSQDVRNEALNLGEFGNGVMGLGGGLTIGKTFMGVPGIQFTTRFAQGGPVMGGIASLVTPTKT